MTFQELLKRDLRGLTYEQGAIKTGFSAVHLMHLAKGTRRPSREAVQQIARAWKRDVDEYLLAAGYCPETIPIEDILELKRQRTMARESDEKYAAPGPVGLGPSVRELVEVYVPSEDEQVKQEAAEWAARLIEGWPKLTDRERQAVKGMLEGMLSEAGKAE